MAQEFTFTVAGCTAQVFPLYDLIGTMCKDYLTDAAPDFTITVTPENIDYEREKFFQLDAQNGLPPQQRPDAFLETLAVHRQLAYHLVDHDALLFHGSAVAVDGQAYLFTALSGTGKSTLTRREALPFLLQQSYRPTDAAQFARSFALLDRLTEHLPLYRLHCDMDPQAAVVAYQGMGGTEL